MKFRRGLTQWEAIEELPDGTDTEALEFLKSQFRFLPRKAEAQILVKIEEVTDSVVEKLFGYVEAALEGFYAKVRKADGRDDFSSLTGEELEETILAIQRTIYAASGQVSRYYNEVFMAFRIQEDEYAENYAKPLDGTKDDRQSYAIRNTRDSRYYYLYSYMIWHRLSDKLNALKDLLKTLEFYRSRSLKEGRWGYN